MHAMNGSLFDAMYFYANYIRLWGLINQTENDQYIRALAITNLQHALLLTLQMAIYT